MSPVGALSLVGLLFMAFGEFAAWRQLYLDAFERSWKLRTQRLCDEVCRAIRAGDEFGVLTGRMLLDQAYAQWRRDIAYWVGGWRWWYRSPW